MFSSSISTKREILVTGRYVILYTNQLFSVCLFSIGNVCIRNWHGQRLYVLFPPTWCFTRQPQRSVLDMGQAHKYALGLNTFFKDLLTLTLWYCLLIIWCLHQIKVILVAWLFFLLICLECLLVVDKHDFGACLLFYCS